LFGILPPAKAVEDSKEKMKKVKISLAVFFMAD
jgi:hypothetical protein